MSFPKADLERAIRDEVKSIKDEAIMRGASGPKGTWEPEIDSLNALRISLRIEEETNLYIPEDKIPAGGFTDVESCVTAFLNESEKAWQAAKEDEVVK
jgi:acyl carrier protein